MRNWRDYYSRQLILDFIGEDGQKRLGKAKVAIVGLGGLGSNATIILSRVGVGYLRLIDYDKVALSDLHRQVLYTVDDLGKPKAKVAAEKIAKFNPYIKVDYIVDKLSDENIDEYLNGIDVIVDGLDNMYTRYIVNRYSVRTKTPYIFSGVLGLEGSMTTIKPPKTPCLECIFSNVRDEDLPKISEVGIIPNIPAIMGVLEAMEVIKLIVRRGETLEGKLLYVDLHDLSFDITEVKKVPNCPVCGNNK